MAAKVIFEDCKVETILMQSVGGWWIFPRTYKVILEDTVVSGDITFEDEGGVVVLKETSRVDGNVIGGYIK